MKKSTKRKDVYTKKASLQGGKVLGGALVGTVFGITAGILLAPDPTKKMRVDFKKLSGDFYRYIAPRMKRLKRVGEEEYNAFVSQGVQKYAKTKGLSVPEERVLAREAKKSWKHIKKHLR